jgi:hypothetical protein
VFDNRQGCAKRFKATVLKIGRLSFVSRRYCSEANTSATTTCCSWRRPEFYILVMCVRAICMRVGNRDYGARGVFLWNRHGYRSISKSILHNWIVVVPSPLACFRGYFEAQPGTARQQDVPLNPKDPQSSTSRRCIGFECIKVTKITLQSVLPRFSVPDCGGIAVRLRFIRLHGG